MCYRNGFSWLRQILLTMALCLAHLAPLAAAPQEVHLVTSVYPPYFGPDLPNGGVITEIVREAFRRTGYNAKLEFLPTRAALCDVYVVEQRLAYPACGLAQ
ncbi:hypothetical protein [Chitinimonas sp. BJB300]|uniref:hypothetical protein n=1 Tax=Chitinimonas sp. BJB300 TaxID=1559339 RepID=UPI001642993B|nr:hypothetical protein [Chitinimonas sp. BJB300]